VKYYKDAFYENMGKEGIDPNIDVFWYTGRPDYVSDSMFAIRWEGKLLPKESGPHQFHLKSFDAKRLILDNDTLSMVYTSVEQYTEIIDLEAGKTYDFVLETENTSTGAARMQLFWKTPEIFTKEKTNEERPETRNVYLPLQHTWIDFWTGEKHTGGNTLTMDAPIDIIPILIKGGSIIPTGPFLQYSTEKPADPIELRIYPGADGEFTLYEDENDNYNYEKGVYATIDFSWDDKNRKLTIGERRGEFPGMLQERTFNLVLVRENQGTGINTCETPDRVVQYSGDKIEVEL
jgi:alpha-D-xyloside xylohydrolase